MTSSSKFIRQHILDLPPYQPVFPLGVLSEELGIPIEKLVKLDANENPFGPLPEVKEALSEIESIHIYPDPETREIRKLLADHHSIQGESIIMGAGADELIDLIMRVVLNSGDKILNCPPTFGMYAFDATLNQANVISIPRKYDFSLDIEALIAAITEFRPKILFLANPNNPDGSTLSQDAFEKLISQEILLVMDEAYIEFARGRDSYIPQLTDHPNLIVLRTFSKWAGLAGLRIGYGVFHTDMTPILMKAKQPYNVSIAAETAAVATLKNLSKAEDRIARIIEQRSFLFDELAKIPWLNPYPSQGNFILCKVMGRSAPEVWGHLRKQGILIRYFDKPGLSDHIRISVGTEEQNQQLLNALIGRN
jgi:histidinol-phosphate aminotransferase